LCLNAVDPHGQIGHPIKAAVIGGRHPADIRLQISDYYGRTKNSTLALVNDNPFQAAGRGLRPRWANEKRDREQWE